ncbi:PFL_4703 family integrating conjugative element protein [Vibrio mediterranei]|uniref:PFL_4703 family integrating conjugative element protein n=1 Tax=Vibrio mediterranei TaxID=689 RepID=UPI00406960E3
MPKNMVGLVQELQSHIRTLRLVLVMMLCGLLFSIHGNVTSIDKLTVHIPPDLTNGAVMKVGEIPRASVFVNTSYLWIEFNSWMNNGTKDAYANLNAYQEYFSPQFISIMRAEYDRKITSRALERQRRLTLIPGTSSEAVKRVQPISNQSWVVYLDVVDEEFYMGERVKNSKIRYALLVEKTETTVDRNPLGLRIVGFKEEPRLLQEL